MRVFNKQGRIVFSSDARRDRPARVDKSAEACYACHAHGSAARAALDARALAHLRARADGHRVLGIINPIQNEPGCSDRRLPRHGPTRRCSACST